MRAAVRASISGLSHAVCWLSSIIPVLCSHINVWTRSLAWVGVYTVSVHNASFVHATHKPCTSAPSPAVVIATHILPTPPPPRKQSLSFLLCRLSLLKVLAAHSIIIHGHTANRSHWHGHGRGGRQRKHVGLPALLCRGRVHQGKCSDRTDAHARSPLHTLNACFIWTKARPGRKGGDGF